MHINMDKNTKLTAVLFDMDGLMFDTERIFLEAWEAVKAPAGLLGVPVKPEDTLGMSVSDTILLLVAAGMEEAAAQEAFMRVDSHRRKLIQRRPAPIKPGLRELLTFLQAAGIPAAVASSAGEEEVRYLLDKAGILTFFQTFATGDQVLHSKPEPDIFLLAANRLGVQPEGCMVLEDSHNGIRAAHAAGMLPVMVPDLLQPEEWVRPLLYDCLPDLFAVKELIETSGM